MSTYPVKRRYTMERTAGELLRMIGRGLAWYSEPGSGSAYQATGPSFHTTVRVAGVLDFASADVLAAANLNDPFRLEIALPDYPLSS